MNSFYFKISTQAFYICLMCCFMCNIAFAQTKIESFVFTLAGGSAQATNMKIIATIGEFSPPGEAKGGSNSLFSGFINTLDIDIEVPVPDIQAPQIKHDPITNEIEGQEIPVEAVVTDNTNVASAILSYRRGGESAFITAQMLEGATDSWQAVIPGNSVTDRGVEYFISAVDDNGNTARELASNFFAIRISVPDPGIVKNTTQPADTAQTAYRLISVPLDLVNKSAAAVLEDDLGEYDPTNWRFWEISPNQSSGDNQPYREFTNTSLMTPGEAFWLIVKDSGKRIDTGEGNSISTSEDFRINLNQRWNFVANPFNFSIPRANIRLEQGGQNIDINRFDGTDYPPLTTNLEPFEGYALYTEVTDRLIITPRETATSTSVYKKAISEAEEPFNWSIRILAHCQEARDTYNFAAVASGASDGWDEQDRAEPPVIGETFRFISLTLNGISLVIIIVQTLDLNPTKPIYGNLRLGVTSGIR